MNKKAGWQKFLTSLSKNKGLKILSLALALALWFAVGGEERIETGLKLSLELVNIPADLIITNDISPQIEVRIQGPHSVVRELSAERLHKRIDLTGYKPGNYVFPLSPGSFDFPRGVVVTRIRPNAITVILDKAITRRLEIHPVIKGSPAPGYELVKVKMSPERIEVKGPESELSQLNSLNTLPIEISHLSSPVTREVDLNFQNLRLSYVGNKPILADLEIHPIQKTKVLTGVEIVPTMASGPVQLHPPRVSLTIRGPAPKLDDLSPNDLTAEVDLHNLKPGRHKVRVNAQLPPGLELLSIQPQTVQVRLKKTKKKS
ncbi:MAG: hypothetical protein JRI57_00120 [Deltaproteobacteria bacterium]|nr:hypothetical protein [Deltaproteobacteria bacterium]MBW1951476.1 hypothetical protein [Deltaproteobacteria bacterium]